MLCLSFFALARIAKSARVSCAQRNVDSGGRTRHSGRPRPALYCIAPNRIESGHRNSITDFKISTSCMADSPTLWLTPRSPARMTSGLDRLILLAVTLAVPWVTSTHLAQGQGVMHARDGPHGPYSSSVARTHSCARIPTDQTQRVNRFVGTR